MYVTVCLSMSALNVASQWEDNYASVIISLLLHKYGQLYVAM